MPFGKQDERVLNGTRRFLRGHEEVVETWRDSRLVERRFSRLDRNPEGTIVIQYMKKGKMGNSGPGNAILHNGYLDYTVKIETVAAQQL